MNPQTPTTDSNVSLRPRIRRLVSIGDDEPDRTTSPPVNSRQAQASSPTSTLRAASPIPSAHLSRSTTSIRPQWSKSTASIRGLDSSKKDPTTSLFSPQYWETSWSSLQGFASTLLRNEVRNGERPCSSPERRGRQGGQVLRYGALPNVESWGPSGNLQAHLASGLDEDRAARVQARKRETLLNANQHLAPDTRGKLKRRTSVDQSAATEAEEPDPLVYVYQVQPGDTLAGVAIKFNCSQAAFRRINRLWPNDNIQTRKFLLLPVDTCGVRGYKLAGPGTTSDSLTDDDGRALPLTEDPPYQDWIIPGGSSKAPTLPAPKAERKVSPDFPDHSSWDHDSWVRIDGFPSPVEVARPPRRHLGFFPPARRKSATRTHESSVSAKSDSPPATSPGRERDTLFPSAPTSSRHIQQSSAFPSPRSSISYSHTSAAGAAAHFVSTLRGPGGVGTLGREAKGPGPAPDKLNEILAPHLPSMAPPASALPHASVASLQVSGNHAPRASFESVGSAGSLEALGGKVERWARKMAAGKKAPASTQGDLIELVEGWDAGGNYGVNGDNIAESEELTDRGRARKGVTGDRASQKSAEDGGHMDEQMLAERFGVPTGGRVFKQRH